MDTAIHQFILSNQQSLLVVEEEKIVGILRLTDVFAAVFHIMMKQCTPEGRK
jgi:predicted transcriptional regulator